MQAARETLGYQHVNENLPDDRRPARPPRRPARRLALRRRSSRSSHAARRPRPAGPTGRGLTRRAELASAPMRSRVAGVALVVALGGAVGGAAADRATTSVSRDAQMYVADDP